MAVFLLLGFTVTSVITMSNGVLSPTVFAIPAHERQIIMSGVKKEKIQYIKQETISAKSTLIRQYERLCEVSAPEADRLGKIIARLEAWQHR